MPNVWLTRALCNMLDWMAKTLRGELRQARHIKTGRRGEDQAYYHLRELGYMIVARNWRTVRHRGELDLIGWDQNVLCFIEVKTRTSRDVKPAEAAVDREKRRQIARMARAYVRRLRPGTPIRFDVVSVYLEADGQTEIQVFKNAYSWRSMKPARYR
jgi:putative endonuclease